MGQWLMQRINDIFRLARRDAKYAEMQQRYNDLERLVNQSIQQLPEETQDIFWEYLCLSDAMNWRVLELVLGGFPLHDQHSTESEASSD